MQKTKAKTHKGCIIQGEGSHRKTNKLKQAEIQIEHAGKPDTEYTGTRNQKTTELQESGITEKTLDLNTLGE